MMREMRRPTRVNMSALMQIRGICNPSAGCADRWKVAADEAAAVLGVGHVDPVAQMVLASEITHLADRDIGHVHDPRRTELVVHNDHAVLVVEALRRATTH